MSWRLVYVVDHDERQRNSVARALGQEYAVSPLASLEELAKCWPHDGFIVLADGPGMLSKCMDAMCEEGVCLPVICYSMHPSTETLFAALCKGACGYIELPINEKALCSTIGAARTLFDSTRAARVRKQQATVLMSRLSRREREVLGHVMLGLCGKTSARELAISPRTVELHRSKVLAKLGAGSLLAASVIAMDSDERPDLNDCKGLFDQVV